MRRALLVLAASLLTGCTPEPRYEERSVVIYAPKACPITQDNAYAVLYGGGDFQAVPEAPPIAKLFLRDVGKGMTELPSATRSIVADVSERDAAWRGFAEVPPKGPVNVLVWPSRETCRLSRDVEPRNRSTFGIFGRQFLVVGGEAAAGGPIPNTYVGDLTTGIIERLPIGIARPRVFASVTPIRVYDDPGAPLGALVAGGQDPNTGRLDDTAELYVPRPDGSAGEFEATRIQLVDGRSDHGAVVLQTGETLLVGGRGPGGALSTLEIIDPDDILDPTRRRSRTAGLVTLEHARIRPHVMRLASGEILVAGGEDSSGRQVPVLEWLAPDARSRSKRKFEPFVMGRERAFVPLDAGGALAVISPEVPSPDFKTVWVISADGTPEPAIPLDPLSIVMLRLFQGSDGAPVLWDGVRWLRWDPWFGAFQQIRDAPEKGPKNHGIANGDSGLALWLEEQENPSPNGAPAGMYVWGYRFASRTPFDTVPSPLLVNGTSELAPDRYVGLSSAIRFEPERGLVLGAGASAFLTDVTFADFSVELDVTGEPPAVILRPENGREYAVGGGECAFGQSAQRSLHVVRRGGTVRVSVDGGEARACPQEISASARVSLGLRGGSRESSAKNLRVTRL